MISRFFHSPPTYQFQGEEALYYAQTHSKHNDLTTWINVRLNLAIKMPFAAAVTSLSLYKLTFTDVSHILMGNINRPLVTKILRHSFRATCVLLSVLILPLLGAISPRRLLQLNALLNIVRSPSGLRVHWSQNPQRYRRILAAAGCLWAVGLIYLTMRDRARLAEDCQSPTDSGRGPRCWILNTKAECEEYGGYWKDDRCLPQRDIKQASNDCLSATDPDTGWPSCEFFNRQDQCEEQGGYWDSEKDHYRCRPRREIMQMINDCVSPTDQHKGWPSCSYFTSQATCEQYGGYWDARICWPQREVTQAIDDCTSLTEQHKGWPSCAYFKTSVACEQNGGFWDVSYCRPYRLLTKAAEDCQSATEQDGWPRCSFFGSQATCESNGGYWDSPFCRPQRDVLQAVEDCRSETEQYIWPTCSIFNTQDACSRAGGEWRSDRLHCHSKRVLIKIQEHCKRYGGEIAGTGWDCKY